MTSEAFSKRLAMGWSSVGAAEGSNRRQFVFWEGSKRDGQMMGPEFRHGQKSLMIRRAGRGRSIHTDTVHAGAV